MKTIITLLALLVSSVTFADQTKALQARLGKLKISCTSSRVFGAMEVKVKNNELALRGLCWGGVDISTEMTETHTVIECGDDGTQTTVLNVGTYHKLERGLIFDGMTSINMQPGYPFAKGNIAYLICEVK